MTDALLDALQNGPRRQQIASDREATMIRDRFIMKAFRKGFDTFEIAKALKVDESVVANRLAQLRDAEASA